MKKSLDEKNQSNAHARENEPAAVWVRVSELTPWDKNPRKNDKAAKEVAKSIKRFGFGAPLLARRENGEIIGGHTRLKAAAILGLEMVPVRYLDLDPAEAHLLALADNKLGEKAEWDDTLLAEVLSGYGLDDAADAGFTEKDLEALGTELGADDQSDDAATDFSVLITCDNEEHQLEIIERCQKEGWQCRALT